MSREVGTGGVKVVGGLIGVVTPRLVFVVVVTVRVAVPLKDPYLGYSPLWRTIDLRGPSRIGDMSVRESTLSCSPKGTLECVRKIRPRRSSLLGDYQNSERVDVGPAVESN